MLSALLILLEIKGEDALMADKDQLRMLGDDRSRDAGRLGGRRRASKLSPEERSRIAREAALSRWGRREVRPLALVEGDSEPVEVLADEAEPERQITDEYISGLPQAKYKGVLRLVMDTELPCYVLSDGRRVIGRTSATEMLTGIKGGGAFEKYIGVGALRPFIDTDEVASRMVSFQLPEVAGLERHVRGLPAEDLIEVCRGFVGALEAHSRSEARLTSRQIEMAMRASMFLAACAKVGLEALIDEATGYQYDRAQDALEVKLRAYLDKEMRTWEKTFPDELWKEFGRLTGWSHSVTRRPKYWGHLVMELVYEYLDRDVAEWLKQNAPAPRHGSNYHQWLSSQYGLQKLVEHIWKVIGISKTCHTMTELKEKMAVIHGRQVVHYQLYLPMPVASDPSST
jgi:hypothetical protein